MPARTRQARTWPRLSIVALAAALASAAAPAHAQVGAGVEVTRERATYHFENPSSINTEALVPHFFEQHYVLDNVWLTGAARYRAGIDWETAIGITRSRQALATDYDTFYNPGSITWVAGTTGDARGRSWQFSQQVRLGRVGPLALHGGYRLRVDAADFLAGDRTVTRNGVLVNRQVVTTPEYTSAQRHELLVGARWSRSLSPAWTFEARGDVAPAAIHRLAIQLPAKYPGVTLDFRTTALVAQGLFACTRDFTRWTLTLSVDGATTLNYQRSQRVSRRALGGALRLGRRW